VVENCNVFGRVGGWGGIAVVNNAYNAAVNAGNITHVKQISTGPCHKSEGTKKDSCRELCVGEFKRGPRSTKRLHARSPSSSLRWQGDSPIPASTVPPLPASTTLLAISTAAATGVKYRRKLLRTSCREQLLDDAEGGMLRQQSHLQLRVRQWIRQWAATTSQQRRHARMPRNLTLSRDQRQRAPTRSCLSPTTGQVEIRTSEVPLFIRWEQYVPEFLPAVEGVTFVQVGANCGSNSKACAKGGDPIWNYAASCGWSGIAIEPMGETFAKLCDNYASLTSRVLPLRAAITERAGEAWLARPQRTSETARVVRLLGPPPVPHGDPRRHEEVPEWLKLSTERVPALALSDVWPLEGPDVLAVDAEGHEEQLLGFAPLPTPLPRLVLFEHAQLSSEGQARIHHKLAEQNFTWLADLKHQDPLGKTLPGQDRLYGRTRLSQRTAGRPSSV